MCVCDLSSPLLQKEDGSKGRRTRPYIIDLGSANGTFVNNKQIEAQRYVNVAFSSTSLQLLSLTGKKKT